MGYFEFLDVLKWDTAGLRVTQQWNTSGHRDIGDEAYISCWPLYSSFLFFLPSIVHQMRYNLNRHHQHVNTRTARVNLVYFCLIIPNFTWLMKQNNIKQILVDEPRSKLLWNKTISNKRPHTIILLYLKIIKLL